VLTSTVSCVARSLRDRSAAAIKAPGRRRWGHHHTGRRYPAGGGSRLLQERHDVAVGGSSTGPGGGIEIPAEPERLAALAPVVLE